MTSPVKAPTSPATVPAPGDFANRLIRGHAAEAMRAMPQGSVDLVITSPPYWTAVAYEGQADAWPSYPAYLEDMLTVWRECARVLRPNGKLCINAPIMPLPKVATPDQHTRHLKNIAADIEQSILADPATGLDRYAFFVWQKQTSKLMFGSYPYPGNILENNTVEFINVYVKPGKPPKFPQRVKDANALTRSEWIDLAQQVWFMYPEDVKREEGHPAPFPEKLPARLMRLYTFGAHADFPGEIVLDPFVGTGTTCAVARTMGRRWIGIDTSQQYLDFARRRIDDAQRAPLLLVGRARYPGKEELAALAAEEAGTAGKQAEPKHKRQTYGRGAEPGNEEQLRLV